jgi:hypothetical protein
MKKKALLLAAVTGLFTLTGAIAPNALFAEDVKADANACKGAHGCGGANACAGASGCAGMAEALEEGEEAADDASSEASKYGY